MPSTLINRVGVTMNACPSGYTAQNGVCLSQGCIDGRSTCVVVDGAGNKCTYDQMLNILQNTGVRACPRPGMQPAQETGVFINPAAPGGQPIPGTQPMPPSPGSQPAPDGLPSQSTNPGVTITPTASPSAIVGVNWKRVGLLALGLAVVGGLFAAHRGH